MNPENSGIEAESSESTFNNIIQILADSGGRLSLTDAAQLSGLSASRFSHAFRKMQGLSFRSARQHAKLKMASTLLSGTKLRITRIAELVGYSELSKFERAFRRHFGMNPRSYRAANSSTGMYK